MKLLLLLVSSCLAGSLPREEAVNDVLDLVESSLGENRDGRALLITLTLTQVSTDLQTLMTTLTTNTKCVKTAIMACPEAVVDARSEEFRDVEKESTILTSSSGDQVDVSSIKPTKRSLLDDLDVDGVLHELEEPLSTGSLNFREVRMDNLYKDCGRSDGPQRMPRILIPSVMSTTQSLTTTIYESTVYSSTATFEVPTSYCTNSDYPTDGFFATAMVCA